jgi:hypothetical protein
MRRLRFARVDIDPVDQRPAAWTFAGGTIRGIEHRYTVLDKNHVARNKWEFLVRVPNAARGRIEVRPATVPNDSILAGLERRSITFMPATLGRYRHFRYCQLSLADPAGARSRRVVRSSEKSALPYWLRLGSRLKQKATVRKTKGTDRQSLVVLVRAEDHRRMIWLFLGTKAWVLKRNIQL